MDSVFTYTLYGVAAVLLAVSFIKDKRKTLLSLKRAWKMFIGVLPQFVAILLLVGLLLSVLIISLVCGIFIGRALPKQPEVSFYANILENFDAYLLIEGISENDINHRSQYMVTLKNKYSSVLDINGTSIDLSDIPEGCMVRIIYDGIVHETYPAQIDGVISIQIVE